MFIAYFTNVIKYRSPVARCKQCKHRLLPSYIDSVPCCKAEEITKHMLMVH